MECLIEQRSVKKKLDIEFTAGDVVRKLRLKAGYRRLEDFAVLAGVAKGTLQKIETDFERATQESVLKVATALKVDVATLYAHANPVFVDSDERRLISLYGDLDETRRQLLLRTGERIRDGKLRIENLAESLLDHASPAKKATG